MFTIYTLGDVNTFRQVLNAVAMVFGDGILSSSTGIGAGSAILAGLLVTLMLSLASGALSSFGMGKNFNPGIVIVLLVIYVGMAVPKVSVNVEDFYTGTATTVDNIPVGLALPAALISTITKSVTEKMETAFSTTDGNYIAMTSQGFVNPLNLLLTMRQGVQNFDPYLEANIKVFTLDCVVGASTFDQKAFSVAPDAIAYLTTNYRDGLTLSFSPANPQGAGVPCNQAATAIQNDAEAFLTSAEFNQLLNSKMPSRATPNTSTPNTYTAADLDTTYQNLVQPVWGAAQNAQGFMKNALLANVAGNAFNCAASASDYAALNQCDIMLTQASEQWKADAAGQAGFFTNMMVPGMNILLAMFYAFSPLVFIFAVMSSWHGIHILRNYLLFGAWTQTWLPFAAIINFMIQLMVGGEINRMQAASANGLTLAISNDFYNMLSTKLAVASDMLASVPMISFALLTGGAYAMTQVAGKWSGRDYVDEKQGSPDILKTAPAVQTGSIASQTGSAMEFNPALGWGAGGYGGSTVPNFSLGSANAAAVSNATKQANGYSAQLESGLGLAAKTMTGKSSERSAYASIGAQVSKGTDMVSQAAQKITDDLSQSVEMTSEEKQALSGYLATKIGAGVGIGAMKFGLEGGLRKDKIVSGGKAEKLASAFKESTERGNTISNYVKKAQNSDDGHRWASGMQKSIGKELMGNIRSSSASTASWASELSEQQSHTDTVGANQTMSARVMSERVLGNPQALAALDESIARNGLAGEANRLIGNMVEIGDPIQRATAGKLAALYGSSNGVSDFSHIAGAVSSMSVGDVGHPQAPSGVSQHLTMGGELEESVNGKLKGAGTLLSPANRLGLGGSFQKFDMPGYGGFPVEPADAPPVANEGRVKGTHAKKFDQEASKGKVGPSFSRNVKKFTGFD